MSFLFRKSREKALKAALSQLHVPKGNAVTEYWEAHTNNLPLPSMPGQGTQCKGRCTCRWEIVPINAKKGDYDCYWRLQEGKKKHCQTCEVRAEDYNPVRIRNWNLMIDD